MGLLKSVDNVQGINYYEYRDTLYYNKYEYRLRISIPGIRYTYWCKKPEELDEKLNTPMKSYYKVRKEDVQTVTENLIPLKEVIAIVNERKKDSNYSCRLESNTLAIFSTDLAVLEAFKKRIGEKFALDCTLAQTNGYSGIKYFVNEPKHKYRVYLRSRRVDDSFQAELRDMLKLQKKLNPSNALKFWCNADKNNHHHWWFRWTSAAHFIDYDDESTLSYLALMHGNILGKKYKLEKRPEET